MEKCKSKLHRFTIESELTSVTETESENNMSNNAHISGQHLTLNKPKGYEAPRAVQSDDIYNKENVPFATQVGDQDIFSILLKYLITSKNIITISLLFPYGLQGTFVRSVPEPLYNTLSRGHPAMTT